MKELKQLKEVQMQDAAEIRPVIKKQFVGTVVLSPGQKLFEYHIESGALRQAQGDKPKATLEGGTKVDVIKNPGCIYIAAINKKNAFRKVVKQLL